jgi:hypothetical protein
MTANQMTDWHREIAARTLFETPSAAKAERRLKECGASLTDYAERVFGEEAAP